MFWLSTHFENILVGDERRSSMLSIHSFQFNQQRSKNIWKIYIYEFPAGPTQKMLGGQNEGQLRNPDVKILRRVISTRDA